MDSALLTLCSRRTKTHNHNQFLTMGTTPMTEASCTGRSNATSQATPGQLALGRDMAINVRHVADWNYTQKRKQKVAAVVQNCIPLEPNALK